MLILENRISSKAFRVIIAKSLNLNMHQNEEFIFLECHAGAFAFILGLSCVQYKNKKADVYLLA